MTDTDLQEITWAGWVVLSGISLMGWLLTFVVVRRVWWLIRTAL